MLLSLDSFARFPSRFELTWLPPVQRLYLTPANAANALECFLPSLHPWRKFALKVERKCINFLSPSPKALRRCHVSSLLSDESWHLSSELFLALFLSAHSLPSLFLLPAVLLFSVSCKGRAMDRVTVVFLLSFTWKF